MSRVVPEGRDAYWTHTDEVRAQHRAAAAVSERLKLLRAGV